MSLLTSRRLSTLSSLFRWSKSSSEKDRLESDDQFLIDSPRKHLAWPHKHTQQSRERTAIVTPSGPITLEELLHRTEPAPSLLSLAAQDPVVVAQTPDIVAALLCHITLLRAGLCAVFVDGEGKEAARRACRQTGASVIVLPGEDDTVGWGGLLSDGNVTVLAGSEIAATSREREAETSEGDAKEDEDGRWTGYFACWMAPGQEIGEEGQEYVASEHRAAREHIKSRGESSVTGGAPWSVAATAAKTVGVLCEGGLGELVLAECLAIIQEGGSVAARGGGEINLEAAVAGGVDMWGVVIRAWVVDQSLVQEFDGTGVKSLCVIMSEGDGGGLGCLVGGVKRLQGIGGSIGEGVEVVSWCGKDTLAQPGGGSDSGDYALRLSRCRHGVIGAGGASGLRFDTPIGGGEMRVSIRECGPHSRRGRLRCRITLDAGDEQKSVRSGRMETKAGRSWAFCNLMAPDEPVEGFVSIRGRPGTEFIVWTERSMVWQEDAQNFKSVKVVPRNSIEPGHQPTSMTTKHQNTIYYKVEVPEAGPGCDSRGVIRLEIHGFTSGLTSSLNIMEYNHETTFNDLVACYNQPVYIEKQHEVSRSETRVYMSWRCECPGELSCDWSAYSGATGGVTILLHTPAWQDLEYKGAHNLYICVSRVSFTDAPRRNDFLHSVIMSVFDCEKDLIPQDMHECVEYWDAHVAGHDVYTPSRARKGQGGDALTYGEIELIPFLSVLRNAVPRIEIGSGPGGGKGGGFCDLGCGTGKAMLAAALSGWKDGVIMGIEILPELIEAAVPWPDHLQQPIYLEASFLEELRWLDCHVVYAASLCFDQELLRAMFEMGVGLRPGALLLSLQPIAAGGGGRAWRLFELLRVESMMMSWGQCDVYVYERRQERDLTT